MNKKIIVFQQCEEKLGMKGNEMREGSSRLEAVIALPNVAKLGPPKQHHQATAKANILKLEQA